LQGTGSMMIDQETKERIKRKLSENSKKVEPAANTSSPKNDAKGNTSSAGKLKVETEGAYPNSKKKEPNLAVNTSSSNPKVQPEENYSGSKKKEWGAAENGITQPKNPKVKMEETHPNPKSKKGTNNEVPVVGQVLKVTDKEKKSKELTAKEKERKEIERLVTELKELEKKSLDKGSEKRKKALDVIEAFSKSDTVDFMKRTANLNGNAPRNSADETGKLYTEIVQKRLNEAGITDEEGKPLLEDGIYGEKTKKAHEKAIKIKQFEDENSGVKYGGKSGEKSINEVPDGPGEYEHKVPTTEEMTSYMDNAVLLPIAQEILKNPGSKELQRAFWKTASPLVLKNDPLSLKMLLHSLQDNPSPFTEANFPQIGSLVCSDNNFREEIKEVVANNTSGQLTDYPIDTFNFENGDLSKSIHGVDKITVNGDKNTILATDQMPKPGVSLAKGSVVALYTEENEARTSVTVPDLRGMSLTQAKSALKAKNLNITYEGSGIVTSQSIAHDSSQEIGTVVHVVLKQAGSAGSH